MQSYRSLTAAASLILGTAVALGIHLGAVQTAPAADPVGATTGNAADEKPIRATADAFVKAFNAADAKAIGALWATDAEYTDESGKALHGRADIEKEYAELFKAQRGLTMEVSTDSIRFLGPDIAIEKGVAKVKSAAEKSDSAARYTVVHAKRDGKWVMVIGRDAPYVATTNEDYLKDLGWLIGEWRLDAKDQTLRIKFEWMAQRNFIKNTYITTKDGKESMTGAQIIGWNPKLGQIVSWHFDAQGGFGDDVWTKDGSKWVIEATGIFRNGSESSAVNVLTPIDTNSFTWQSLKRSLDGVVLPNTPPIKMVRIQPAK